jgi:membrane-associated PAP2 superfamily phosphatase
MMPNRKAITNPLTCVRSDRLQGRHGLLLVILFLMIVIMSGIARFDFRWTLALNAGKFEALADFMSRTLFEGEGFGGGDPAILFLAVVAVAYLWVWKVKPPQRSGVWRPWLGFILGTAPVSALYIIHSLKWVMGRARPREVMRQSLVYTDWYEIGPHYITEGIYRGSFPSGHTASVLLLLTLAYLMAGDRRNRRGLRYAGWAWGALVLAYCLTMAVSRSMTMSHWIADSLFTILAGWLVMHCMYFWVLRLPGQIDYYRSTGRHPELPKLWELRLGWHLFLVASGLTLIGLGLRAYWEQAVPWLAALIVPGALLLVFGSRCAMCICRTVWGAIDPAAVVRQHRF